MKLNRLLLLLIFSLTVGCGATDMNSNASHPGTGNGDGYPGGDEFVSVFAGDYYLKSPNHKCGSGSEKKAGYRYMMRIQNSDKIQVIGNPCDNQIAHQKFPWRLIDITVYNPDFLMRGNHIYSKSSTAPGENEETYPEVLCRRKLSDSGGVDVMIFRNADGTEHWGRVYWGVVGSQGYESYVSDTVSVTREETQPGLFRFTSYNLDLTVDHSQITKARGRYVGTAALLPSGVPSIESFNCTHLSFGE